MSKHRVRNLTKSSFAASRYLKEAEQWEWCDISTSADELDAGKLKNLWVRCALCNMNVTQPCMGALMCPDCGSEEFDVRSLVLRREFVMDPLGFRLSGSPGNYFLHVTVPSRVVEGSLHYAIGGAYPTTRSTCYRRPIHVTDLTQEFRFRYFVRTDAQSQVFYWRAALTCSCGQEIRLRDGEACECVQCHSVYTQKGARGEWARDARLSKTAPPPPAPKPVEAQPKHQPKPKKHELVKKKALPILRKKRSRRGGLGLLRFFLFVLGAAGIAYWHYGDAWFKQEKEITAPQSSPKDLLERAYEHYYNARYAEAVHLFKLAALRGEVMSQYFLGCCYESGYGVAVNHEKAAEWYLKAAEQGNSNAKAAYEKLVGSQQQDGSQSGKDAEALFERAYALYEDKEYREAVQLFKESAKAGHAGSQYYLGRCYEYGYAGEKNRQTALKWYQKAAVQDYEQAIKASEALAAELANQRPVLTAKEKEWRVLYKRACECYLKKDFENAIRLFSLAAEEGDPSSQTLLGWCYENGDGTAKDVKKAYSWYHKAALQGKASAQYYLARCFEWGRGVEKDERLAAQWYRKSAEQGYAAAQYGIGKCYAEGRGVLKNGVEAMRWYQKAAEQGYGPAKEALESH